MGLGARDAGRLKVFRVRSVGLGLRDSEFEFLELRVGGLGFRVLGFEGLGSEGVGLEIINAHITQSHPK